MPGEVIDRPNPPPLPSQLPPQLAELGIQPADKPLNDEVAQALQDFRTSASYIAAGILTIMRSTRLGAQHIYSQTTIADFGLQL